MQHLIHIIDSADVSKTAAEGKTSSLSRCTTSTVSTFRNGIIQWTHVPNLPEVSSADSLACASPPNSTSLPHPRPRLPGSASPVGAKAESRKDVGNLRRSRLVRNQSRNSSISSTPQSSSFGMTDWSRASRKCTSTWPLVMAVYAGNVTSLQLAYSLSRGKSYVRSAEVEDEYFSACCRLMCADHGTLLDVSVWVQWRGRPDFFGPGVLRGMHHCPDWVYP